jgi:hypothetical protein
MKVFEILRNDTPAATEQQIIERMKGFDWKYEFAEDDRRVKRGQKELELLENLVYQFWKINPDRAVQIWNTYSPGLSEANTVVPSFIFRLQAQE